MQNLYNVNGLMFWSEREIRLRNQFVDHFAFTFNKILLDTNPAWRMMQVEAPILTPSNLLNENYAEDDVWFQELTPKIRQLNDNTRYQDLALRPETTPGSYAYATHLLETHSGIKPPFCVWQVGKSFRREQDNVLKNMRLKEFYQQEFQCFYTVDTMNDYHTAVLDPVATMISEMVGRETRIVESDRLPDYSEITMDVECQHLGRPHKKWMELCSISRRTDFTTKAKFQTKKKLVEKDLLVLEVAIGVDRCVYSFER